jgi:hypothetical protein
MRTLPLYNFFVFIQLHKCVDALQVFFKCFDAVGATFQFPALSAFYKLNIMKYFYIILVCLALGTAACNKSKTCNTVTITQSGTPCGIWGIKINSGTYPSNNIPAIYQQEGLVVCSNYELYDDMRACACCGGSWAKINSMSLPEECQIQASPPSFPPLQ